jgi:hypothetical protein
MSKGQCAEGLWQGRRCLDASLFLTLFLVTPRIPLFCSFPCA